MLITVLSNHLFQPDNSPFSDSYEFPWFAIGVSIGLTLVVIVITELNYRYYKRSHFAQRINAQSIGRFLLTTLGYISIFYVAFYYSFNGFMVETIIPLLNGYVISLLMCVVGITGWYGPDLYRLHRRTAIEGQLKVDHAGKISLVPFQEIAWVYSEHKKAYIVKTDGRLVPTDFTLNEVEEKIMARRFFRANRQTIVHAASIEQVQAIENGKLSVRLKARLNDAKTEPINISRYKKQEFLQWFEDTP